MKTIKLSKRDKFIIGTMIDKYGKVAGLMALRLIRPKHKGTECLNYLRVNIIKG